MFDGFGMQSSDWHAGYEEGSADEERLSRRITELEKERDELCKKLERQPMETAPKDGTEILLQMHDGNAAVVGSWTDLQDWTLHHKGQGPGYADDCFRGWYRLPWDTAEGGE